MSVRTASKAWRLPCMSEMMATFIDAVDPPATRDMTSQSCSQAGLARHWRQSCARSGHGMAEGAQPLLSLVVAEGSDRGWVASLAGAVALAQVGVVALRPRHGVIAADHVDALAHF